MILVPTVNEWLIDEAIRHSIDLARYSNSVVRRILAILNRSDDRLFAELMAALERLPPESFTVERLESLLGSVRALNSQAFAQAGEELTRELREFVEYEAAYQTKTLQSVMPAQVHIASVSAEQAYAAAMARPFQGVLLREVLKDIEATKAKKIRQAVAQGYVEAKTTPQIVREIRGTRAKGYSDGLMEASRRDVEAIVRTAMGHMAGFTQDRVAEANGDIIKAIKWSATLDFRTSEICRVRDGKLWTVEHKPIGHKLPWLGGPGRAHWRCRSAQVFITKSNAELGIDVPDVTLKNGTRATLDGQVPAEQTYGDWLKTRSAAEQDEVLGPTRGKLFRSGKLPLEAMYSQKGAFLTLEELRAKMAA